MVSFNGVHLGNLRTVCSGFLLMSIVKLFEGVDAALEVLDDASQQHYWPSYVMSLA